MALRVGQAAQSGLTKNELLRVLGSEVQRTMIRFQIVEREGVDLYRTLLQAIVLSRLGAAGPQVLG